MNDWGEALRKYRIEKGDIPPDDPAPPPPEVAPAQPPLNQNGQVDWNTALKTQPGTTDTSNPIPEGFVLDPKTGAMMNTKAIAEEMNKGALGQITAFGGSAAQGLPGGTFLDEAIGAVGGPVKQEVARQRVKQFDKNNPKTALGGKIAAGASAIVPAMMGGVSFAAGQTALPKVAAGLGVDSALLGGAFKSGQSEGNLTDRLKAGAEGAAEGGAMGFAMPVAFRALGTVAKPAWDAIKMAFAGPAHLAQARVADVMKQFNLTPTQVNAAVKELGPEGKVIDVLGEGGKRLAKSSINRSPAAGDILLDSSNKRMAGQPERVVDALLKASGLNAAKTPNEVVKALVKASKPGINSAYNAAREAGHDIPKAPFAGLNKSKMVKSAMKQGAALARERAIAEGTGKVTRFDTLNEAKKILSDKAVPKFGKPQTAKQSVSGKMAEVFRGTVDDNLPIYANARGKAQEAFQQQDAVRQGAALAKPNVTTELTGNAAAAGPELQPFIGQGFAGEKIQQVLNKAGTPGALKTQFNSPQKDAAIAAALRGEAKTVTDQVAREARFGQTHQGLTGNSTTVQQGIDSGAFPTSRGGLIARAYDTLKESLIASKEADIAPLVAKILDGRDVSGAAMKALEKAPVIRDSVVEILSLTGAQNTPRFTGP